jgi:TRAP-type C4-dicarboxylate transport system substrate-binding protein
MILTAGLLLSGCTSSAVDKSGGEGPVLELTMATSDQPGGPQAVPLEQFADQVAEESDGRMRIDVTYAAMGEDHQKFDQRVAGLVQDGSYDLGVVPARSWDDLDVAAFRALQTPFLLESDNLVDAVVADDLADAMLKGLDGTGVRGLVLWPDALRHPVGYGTALLRLADFRGAELHAPYSRDVYAMLRTLGSEPSDLDRTAITTRYAAGTLDGTEGGADLAFGPPSTVTADVTLYAKINTIVANDEAWSDLSDAEQAVLTEAARSTRDWLVSERPREGELLADACTNGTGVAVAGAAAVAEIREATREQVQELRADPHAGPAIERIEALSVTVGADPGLVFECAAESKTSDIGELIDPAVLDGTYRAEFTDQEFRQAGADAQSAASNAGIWTITMDGGRYSAEDDTCTATYDVSETMIAFRWDPGECTGDWTAQWELTERGLRFTDVQSAYAVDRALWGLHEWIRLD